MDEIRKIADGICDEIVSVRREIHKNPEPGNQEFKTSALIKEKLTEYGVDEIITPGGTAVVGVIKGRKGDGKCIGIRCDMDALPVKEETGLPFASEVDGMMHACGHDMHTAMMIGNAKILCELRDSFAGTVKLIFEPSEEYQPGGARPIIESGAVDDVDAFFGMHVLPTDEAEVGKVGIKRGPVTTSADEVYIDILGRGGHGSQPHKAKDAILAASQLVVLFQQVQARNIDPLDTVIFTMNVINGGAKVNIMPEKASLVGCIRCYTKEAREVTTQKIHDICRGVESISGCQITENVVLGYDACSNDDALVDVITSYYDEHLGEDSYYIMKEPMGFSEDYSFFSTMTGKPSVLMFLSAGHAEGKEKSVLHLADCTFDESAIPSGMIAMISAVFAALEA